MAADRRRDELNRDLAIAWYVAALSRQDKLPKLETLMAHEARTTATVAQRRSQAAMLADFLGTQMRPISQAAMNALKKLRRES